MNAAASTTPERASAADASRPDASWLALDPAADIVRSAEALIVLAGAGMSVDSGLPAFRTAEGLWGSFPPARALGLSFEELACPAWFRDDPALAWGFYGWRLNAYRQARPHVGHEVLRRWAAAKAGGAFVVTTNVDGLFQRAGFDAEAIFEEHGTIHVLQCADRCGTECFPAPPAVDVDAATFRARSPLPQCPACGAVARPNILMFGDLLWDDRASIRQQQRFAAFLEDRRDRRMCVLEVGAGVGLPVLRRLTGELLARPATELVRINLDAAEVVAGGVGLRLPAAEALAALDGRITGAPGAGGDLP